MRNCKKCKHYKAVDSRVEYYAPDFKPHNIMVYGCELKECVKDKPKKK